jgi:hypothetical protein
VCRRSFSLGVAAVSASLTGCTWDHAEWSYGSLSTCASFQWPYADPQSADGNGLRPATSGTWPARRFEFAGLERRGHDTARLATVRAIVKPALTRKRGDVIKHVVDRVLSRP